MSAAEYDLCVADSRPDTWQHIEQVRGWLHRCVLDLLRRGQRHDHTKLHPPELEAFDRMTPALADLTVGTPEYETARKELGAALEHHYQANSHHPEHYPNGIREMSLLDLLEMVCDWKASGERHKEGGDLHHSIEVQQERFGYSDELKSILHATANALVNLGA